MTNAERKALLVANAPLRSGPPPCDECDEPTTIVINALGVGVLMHNDASIDAEGTCGAFS
jgi:hypothetical protein